MLLKVHFQYSSYLPTFYSLEILGSHCKTHAKNLMYKIINKLRSQWNFWQLNKPKINCTAVITAYCMPSLYPAFYTCSRLFLITIVWGSYYCFTFTEKDTKVHRGHIIWPLLYVGYVAKADSNIALTPSWL